MYGDSKIHIDQCDHITLSHLERWIFMSVAVKILYSIQSPIQLLSFNGWNGLNNCPVGKTSKYSKRKKHKKKNCHINGKKIKIAQT